MCGIAGFVDPGADLETLKRMTSRIARRGPDDFGYYHEGGVGLGHRRLAIIDLSPAGHQPMRFEHLILIFNGEIYNYREVAQELAAAGYAIESSSDTEVVIKAFHRWGPACVQRFIGMFALAVYDIAERTMYLIRDRAGVKPLYYYCRDGRLAFGSELRCFKPYLSADERLQIDPAGLSQFLSVGYVGQGNSIVESVKKIPAGHFIRFAGGSAEVHRYWQVAFEPEPTWKSRSEDDLLDELEAIVVSAFKYRMVADVPVGVFLSAGVDSSLVTAVLSKHYGPLRTFTIGFAERAFDESADARKIAAYLGTDHVEGTLTPQKGAEILGNYHDIFDEPHADPSCVPTTYVSEIAKKHGVKVVLSADAGDELFGGYQRYLDFPARWTQTRRAGGMGRHAGSATLRAVSAAAPYHVARRLNRYADLMVESNFLHFYQNMMLQVSRGDLKSVYPNYVSPLILGSGGDSLAEMSSWDFHNYMVDDILVKVDRATMFHSIEGREPFLDHRLVEFAAKLPSEFKIRDGETKFLLKKLLGRYLPDELFRLPKRGFGAPIVDWTRDLYGSGFADVIEQHADNFFDQATTREMLQRYRTGQPINYAILWYLFTFLSWYAKWTSDD